MLEMLTQDAGQNFYELRLHGRRLIARNLPRGVELAEHIEALVGGAGRLGTSVGMRIHTLGILPRDQAEPTLSVEALIDRSLGDTAAQRAGAIAAMGALFAWSRCLRSGHVRIDQSAFEQANTGAGRRRTRGLNCPDLSILGRGLHTIDEGCLRPLHNIPADPAQANTAHERMRLCATILQVTDPLGWNLRPWLQEHTVRLEHVVHEIQPRPSLLDSGRLAPIIP